MPWLILALAILSEVTGTTMLKFSQGFTRFWPSVGVVVCYAFAIWSLSQTLKNMPVAVAYAIWSSVGTALVALVGWRLFAEPMTALKLASMGLIILGVVGLNFTIKH